MSNKLQNNNNLWLALNFILPKWKRKGEKLISKFIKYRVYVDQDLVGEVDYTSPTTFVSNIKVGCEVNILRINTKQNEEQILSNFHYKVGDTFALLYLNENQSKIVQLDFANQNRLEVSDDRDWDFIEEVKQSKAQENED